MGDEASGRSGGRSASRPSGGRLRRLALAALLLLPGCSATDIATPEQVEALAAGDQKLDALQADIDALQTAYLESLSEIKGLAAKAGTVDGASLQQAAAAVLSAAQALDGEWRDKVAAYESEADAQGNLVGAIIEDVSKPFIPLLPPGPAQLAPLLLGLLFDRPRKHAGAAIEHALKGSLAEAVKSLAKIPGLLHSDESEQPAYGGPGDTVPK